MVGSAATLFESLELGACGAILALANAFPELCFEIYDASRSGSSSRAHSLAQQLLAPAKILGPQYGIPGLKYSLDRLGYYGGPPRPPLLPLHKSGELPGNRRDALESNGPVRASVRVFRIHAEGRVRLAICRRSNSLRYMRGTLRRAPKIDAQLPFRFAPANFLPLGPSHFLCCVQRARVS